MMTRKRGRIEDAADSAGAVEKQAAEQSPVEPMPEMVAVVEPQPAAPPLVKIQYRPGPYVRNCEGYTWSEEAGWIQAVPLETAVGLLKYPTPGFSLGEAPSAALRKQLADALGVEPHNIVVPGEPILRLRNQVADVTGERRAADLKEQGIKTLAQLAAVQDDKAREALAVKIGTTRDRVRAWAEEAQKLIS